VESDLVLQCISWLDAYVGHRDERYLRRLIEHFVVPIAIDLPATLTGNRLPTTPQRTQPAVLTTV
jgi:hypothetical protein